MPAALDGDAPRLPLDHRHLLPRRHRSQAVARLSDASAVEARAPWAHPRGEVALAVGLDPHERPVHGAPAPLLDRDRLYPDALRRGGERLECPPERDPPAALDALTARRDLETASDHRPRRRARRPARAGGAGGTCGSGLAGRSLRTRLGRRLRLGLRTG